jgi:predicted Fe-S protein YdhL (DUF1289 family)
MSDSEPQSPCVSICHLDEQGICQGCFRTADEVTDWLMASAEEKREILRRAGLRRDASTPFKLSWK